MPQSVKRMEAEVYMEQHSAMPSTMPSVAENTTIAIDVEGLKRKMKKDFYKQMGIGFYPGA